jgi:hypothetical protein
MDDDDSGNPFTKYARQHDRETWREARCKVLDRLTKEQMIADIFEGDAENVEKPDDNNLKAKPESAGPVEHLPRPIIQPGPDDPVRLANAVRLFFPEGSGVTVATLRRAAAQGRLTVEKMNNKLFTTRLYIEEYRKACRVNQKGQDSDSNEQSTKTESSVGKRTGLSMTERSESALAALRRTNVALKKRSPTTSPANTQSTALASVIPLKSSF